MSKYIKNIPLLQFLIGSLRYQSKSGSTCKPKGPRKVKKPPEEPPSKASTFRMVSFVAMGLLSALAGYIFICKEEHKRPEFIPYTYLRLRHKGFPWGDGTRSFFHNRNVNPLPQGYEDDIERKEKERLEKERLEEEKKNKGKKPKPVEVPKEPEPVQEPEKSVKAKKKD